MATAGGLGKIALAYARLNNGDVPFGLTGWQPAGLSYVDANAAHKLSWKPGQPLPGWLDDLVVRLACRGFTRLSRRASAAE